MTGPMAFFLLVVFAPFVETLIMAALLSLLLRFCPPADGDPAQRARLGHRPFARRRRPGAW